MISTSSWTSHESERAFVVLLCFGISSALVAVEIWTLIMYRTYFKRTKRMRMYIIAYCAVVLVVNAISAALTLDNRKVSVWWPYCFAVELASAIVTACVIYEGCAINDPAFSAVGARRLVGSILKQNGS